MEPDLSRKTIMAIGAHPDDNDFGCGASVAKAAAAGSSVIYLVATGGQRGSSDANMTAEHLASLRRKEQERAAELLGVGQVHFLNYMDGELVPDIGLKEKVVSAIRMFRPDIVFTMDQSFFY
jgi:LmbE family N-acetylglucosaminyl deacetylase